MAKERDTKVRAELRKVADVVQREVDAGATTVEEIHKAIARMPLDALEKLDVFEQTARTCAGCRTRRSGRSTT